MWLVVDLCKYFYWKHHWINYAGTRVFTYPYSPVSGRNLQLCLYTAEYAYFMQCIQLNSCNSNSCNSKNHLNRTNSLVLSEFTSKPLQENSFNSNSHNSKNHLNRTNFRSTRRIFHHVIRILVSESSFFILRHSTVVSSNVSIRMP